MKRSKVYTLYSYEHYDKFLKVVEADDVSRGLESKFFNIIKNIDEEMKVFKPKTNEKSWIDTVISGKNVMKHCGITKGGPIIGNIIRDTKEYVIDNGITDEDEIIEKLKYFTSIQKTEDNFNK